MLRKHQLELENLCRRIREGEPITKIIAYIVQGGGKSMLASILAKELVDPLGWKICWLVPRDGLRGQAEKDFNGKNKNMLCYSASIKAVTNDPDPRRGHQGYTTTYQAVSLSPVMHLNEISSAPYILILDESHHIPLSADAQDKTEAAYYTAIAPLVEKAKLTIFCTGSIERHNKNEKIAFFPYRKVSPGEVLERFIDTQGKEIELIADREGEVIDFENLPEGWAYIRYGYKDAGAEKAIAPIIFHTHSSSLLWMGVDGQPKEIANTKNASRGDNSAILEVVLNTQYAFELLDACIIHWQAHKTRNYWAKLLIIASDIEMAKRYCDYLRGTSNQEVARITGHRTGQWRLNVGIATSEDNRDAKDSLMRFKGLSVPEIDILVTVGMAYEGMDVPKITHVAYLTNIRSRPWSEQAFNRGNRVVVKDNNENEIAQKTECHVFSPDDPVGLSNIERIQAEQRSVVVKPEEYTPTQRSQVVQKIVPLSSQILGERQKILGGEVMSDQQVDIFQKIASLHGRDDLSAAVLHAIFTDVLRVQLAMGLFFDGSVADDDTNQAWNIENSLRRAINGAIIDACHGESTKITQMETDLRRRFGARRSLHEDKLCEILAELVGFADAA